MKLSLKNIFKIVIAVVLLAAVAVGVVFLIGNNKPGKPNKWNPDLIQVNLPDTTETLNSYGVKNNTNMSFDSSEIYDRNYVNKGLLVIKSTDGYVGFYSLHYNKFLLERQFYASWLEYQVINNSTFGYFINLRYKDVTYLYDSMGNLVYEGENKIQNVSAVAPVETTYVVLTLDNQEKLAYEYSSNGIPTSYPDPDVVLNLSNQDEDFDFGVDDSYVDIQKLDLAEYGKEGYYLSTSNRIYMFFSSSNNKLISSHNVPKDAFNIKYFGDSLVYQQTSEMPEDSSNYDFSKANKKYQLTTTIFDAFNGGSVRKVNANFVISNSQLYKDLNGKHTLLLATITTINNKKVASEEKFVILDSNLEIVKELTGLEPASFVKIGENYFNYSTKILYNSKLEEISYLGGINPVVNEESEVIVGSISGLYGMLDSNGTVKVPFEYAYINSQIYNNITIGVKEGEHYFLDIASGEAVKVEGTLTKLANKLYLNTLDESIKLVDYTKQNGISTYFELTDLDKQSISSYGLNSNTFGNATYYFIEVKEKVEGVTSYKYHSFILNNFIKTDVTTLGTQEYTDVLDGTSFAEATTIYESSTLSGLHQTGYSQNFAKFEPTETGTYTLSVQSADNVSISYAYRAINQSDYETVTLYKSWQDEEEHKNFTFDFEKNNTYYISYHNSSDPYFTFTLTKEDGSNENAPVLINIVEKETTISAKMNSVKFYRLCSEIDLTLKINNTGVSVYNYNEYYDEYKHNIYSLSLYAGQTKTIVVCGSTTKDATVTFTADLEAYAYGSSKLDSISLSEGDAICITNTPSTQLTDYRYLHFTNTSNSTELFTLYTDRYNYVSYSTVDYGVNATTLQELFTEISVEPNQTIYFLFDLSYLSTYYTINFAIMPENQIIQGNLGLATQFIPSETGEYRLEFISEYKNLEYYVYLDGGVRYKNSEGLYELSSDNVYYVMGVLPVGLRSELLEGGVELNISKKQGTVTVSSDNSSAGSVSSALTVSFNSMGGTPIANQTVTTTTNLQYPDVPTRENYMFKGWYTDPECSTLYDFNSTITKHLTLYAGWEDLTKYAENEDFDVICASEHPGSNAYTTLISNGEIFVTVLTSGYTKIYYRASAGFRINIYNKTQGKYILTHMEHISNYSSYKSVYANVNAGDVIVIDPTNASYTDPTLSLYFETEIPESEYGFASSQVTLFDEETITVTATPNEGYEFLGWYVNETLYSTETTISYKPTTAESNIVAKWTENK